MPHNYPLLCHSITLYYATQLPFIMPLNYPLLCHSVTLYYATQLPFIMPHNYPLLCHSITLYYATQLPFIMPLNYPVYSRYCNSLIRMPCFKANGFLYTGHLAWLLAPHIRGVHDTRTCIMYSLYVGFCIPHRDNSH